MALTFQIVTVFLPDDAATDRLGAWFAAHVQAGDCILLTGPIGAGKSHFSRALIRARLGRFEDVPSPTFTLVQTYQADVEIWHADLYRLSHPDDVLELGLEDAISNAICLIEWPDRLGRFAPKNALRIELASQGDGRVARISCAESSDILTALAHDWPQDV